MTNSPLRLLPCPFCGGTAALKDKHYTGTGSSGMETPNPFVQCTQCNIRSIPVDCDDWPYGQSRGALKYVDAVKVAIKSWNTRV